VGANDTRTSEHRSSCKRDSTSHPLLNWPTRYGTYDRFTRYADQNRQLKRRKFR
jgi:hypothetical protein